MTSETRFLIEVGDVRYLEFTCKKCQARVTRIPRPEDDHAAGELAHYVPTSCPNCKAVWFSEESFALKMLQHLFRALRILKARDEMGCEIRMEIAAPGPKTE